MPKKVESVKKTDNKQNSDSKHTQHRSLFRPPSDEQEDYFTDSSEPCSNDTSDSIEEHKSKSKIKPLSSKALKQPPAQPGKVIHINSEDDYNTILRTSSDSQLIIVKFSAKWCGPCKTIAPKYDALSKQFSNCLFLYIDIDELSDASTVQDVSAVPTFKLFKKGTIVARFTGADVQKLESLIEKNK